MNPLFNFLRFSCALMAVLAVGGTLASGALYPLGDSGWTAAVNDNWDIGVTVDYMQVSAVVIKVQKRFVGAPDEFGLMPPMYLEFIKDSPTALNRIIINDEVITNDTTVPWTDFHMELAVSIDNPEAYFCPCSHPSGDLFAAVAVSGSNGYFDGPTRIDFSNGLVPNDPAEQDDFRPGLESGYILIVANPSMQVGRHILLKEFPTIPEPATLGLLGLSAAVMLWRRS